MTTINRSSSRYPRKISTTFRITPAVAELVSALATLEGRTMSDLWERAMFDYFAIKITELQDNPRHQDLVMLLTDAVAHGPRRAEHEDVREWIERQLRQRARELET